MKKALITALKAVIFFIGWAATAGVLSDVPAKNPAVWRFFAELIPFAIVVVFTIVFLIIEKGTVRLPVFDNIGIGSAVGIISGLIWIGLSASILIVSHQLEITSAVKNHVDMLWLWIISAFINVMMQELLVRGYLYQLLKTRYNLPLAVIVTTALFTFMHGGAFEAGLIPVLNVITMSLFVTALYESQKTIMAPIMAHAAWNIIGGIVLGGVSLAADYPSVFSVKGSDNMILSGGSAKIEGSIVVLIINIALMMIFFISYVKQKASVKK